MGGAEVGVRTILRMLWQEVTPFVKRRLAGVVVLVVIGGALTALSPVALKFIVDSLDGRTGARRERVLWLVMLYVLSLWLARVANEVREMVFGQARQRIFRTLSERLFSHLMHLPMRFHLDRQTGAVSQALDSGLEGLRLALHQLVFTCLPVVAQLITVLLVLGRLATAPLFFLFCAAVVCYVTAYGYSAATIAKAARRASAARMDANAAMTDGLLNYETVKYFTAESLVQDRFARALRRCESAWADFYRRYSLNGMLVAIVFAAFLAGTVVYASECVQRGRMTIGDFVLINTYMLQLVRPLEMMGYAIQSLLQGMAMVEKLVQLFREPTERGSGTARPRIAGPTSLEFKNVCLSYGVGRPALNNVSFRVAAGHTLGIVGPSGSGKSTVVRLLMRLLEPESGSILVDDVAISSLALQELRRWIAVVPQDTVLLDDTVRYNIALGRADASSEEIENAARAAQLHDFIVALPEGYDTMVGERGVKVSGGERQRISIARAILKSPRIYIFDEATSSLDSPTEREILRSVRRVSRANTTVVIAHRLSTVIYADEIVVLERGYIAEQGTHESLLRRNGRYTALWAAQRDSAGAAREAKGA